MVSVSIVIVNYNTFQLLYECVQSIIDKTNGIDYEVIVVDNASSEFDEAKFKSSFPFVRIIYSKRNLGFAGGNNLGIKESEGNIILLLNSDTILINNAIFIAYRYLTGHSEAGVVSAQLQYPDGKLQSAAQRFPSAKYQVIELLRLQKLISKKAKQKLLLGSYFDHESIVEADWVWGTFFMFKREIIEKLPLRKLDESYFMYNEDVQWCWDIKKLGYRIIYNPEAKIIHYMGGSSGNKLSLMKQNGDLFLKRNYSRLHRVLIKALNKFRL